VAQDLPRASGFRRVWALVVDWFAWGVIADVFQVVIPDYGAFYALIAFLIIDVLLTAFQGQTPGRYVARLRVVRVADGGRPGLGPALLRTGLVVISGWLGIFIYLLALRFVDQSPKRMWWDAAAGTQLVPAVPVPAA
jgi:uncharacterized RDD family membrane protein YckC